MISLLGALLIAFIPMLSASPQRYYGPLPQASPQQQRPLYMGYLVPKRSVAQHNSGTNGQTGQTTQNGQMTTGVPQNAPISGQKATGYSTQSLNGFNSPNSNGFSSQNGNTFNAQNSNGFGSQKTNGFSSPNAFSLHAANGFTQTNRNGITVVSPSGSNKGNCNGLCAQRRMLEWGFPLDKTRWLPYYGYGPKKVNPLTGLPPRCCGSTFWDEPVKWYRFTGRPDQQPATTTQQPLQPLSADDDESGFVYYAGRGLPTGGVNTNGVIANTNTPTRQFGSNFGGFNVQSFAPAATWGNGYGQSRLVNVVGGYSV